jgi:hypothetical protein
MRNSSKLRMLMHFGAFAKLWKRLSCVMYLSVRPHGKFRIPLDGFSWNLNIFRKTVQKIRVPLQYDKNKGHFTWRLMYFCYTISLNSSQNENFFGKKFVKKIKMHISCSITFSRKSCCAWDNVENYGRVRQATDNNVMRSKRISRWIIPNATETH